MSDAISPSKQHNSRTLKVGGVTPFTATDFPGMLAAVIFVQGCPWRCGYCHNPHLQPRLAEGAIAWPDVLEFLYRRRELIDGVVFSGGEPAIDSGLTEAIWQVRKMGFAIGLHSAGIYPKRLETLLPWVDWIGLDVKVPFNDYEKVTGVADSGEQARASTEAVLASGIDYECRTTAHPGLLSEDDIVALADELATMGVSNYALQIFRTQGCADAVLKDVETRNYPGDKTLAYLSRRFAKFTLRR